MSVDFIPDESAIRDLLQGEDGPVAKHILKLVVKGEGISKRLVHVATGRLRGSIRHGIAKDADGIYGWWGSDVDYSVYQEFLPEPTGKPYFRPALREIAEGV